jgi:hypothetical protein
MVNNTANPNNIYDSFIQHHISKPEFIKTKNAETEILICTKMYGIHFVNVIPTPLYCVLQRRSKAQNITMHIFCFHSNSAKSSCHV